MTRCADYKPQAAFRTFLFQIARNLWLDLRRSAAESQRAELDDSRPEAPTGGFGAGSRTDTAPESRPGAPGLARPARQWCAKLVVLRFFSEMTLEEIAHTVGEGFETVKSRLRYAFTRLRRELEAQA